MNTICRDFACILLFSLIYKNYLGFRRFFWLGFLLVLFFGFFFYCRNRNLSAKIIQHYPATWTRLDAAPTSTTRLWQTLLQDPRLFPSPSCNSLAKNSPLQAFTPAAVYISPLGEGEPCRVPKALHSLHRKFTGQPTRFKCKLPSRHRTPSLA